MRTLALLTAFTLAPAPAAVAQSATAGRQEPVIVVEGQPFFTWAEYVSSDLFRERGLRCGAPARVDLPGEALLAPSDCGYWQTNPDPQYDPLVVYDIPVVVHVLQSNNGTGYVSPSKVQSQIDILNEDYLAMAGTNGAPGTNTLIQFYLATVDPNGQPTSGITYHQNTTWYNDGGNYWNQLAWDTNRYLNIYTNSAQGYLGYVPDLPQGGIVGSNSDRVVVLWSAFGRNAPIGPPYDQGRTATHEVGHYLGLWHTFDGGCGSSSACYTTGDLICDTNPESQPYFGCGSSYSSCGSSDPIHNYMDYTDDLCMWEFTPEQANRMRCTLENWRAQLYTPGGGGSVSTYCASGTTGSGCQATIQGTGTPSASASSGFQIQVSQVEGSQFGVIFYGVSGPQQTPWNGSSSFLCVQMPAQRTTVQNSGGAPGSCNGQLSLDWLAWIAAHPGALGAPFTAGDTVWAQGWFRDPLTPGTSSMSNGLEFTLAP